ncbi:uncharacterized protein AB675_11866 [Cyphellophora attinorum]|uniref:Uncharacterized protein n=1 Tax=Cyphellophora attinorum TaxID=1664694 RepID=A0A0N0NJA6_9EURO|nr:uncharacterized protein AB675_11866 [Phialophora attinorum]KPI36761.1 hypothetical protein AB675_11866 [Phialophora attinorum]
MDSVSALPADSITMDSFSTLPTEVRHMIYAHLFPDVTQAAPRLYDICICRSYEGFRSDTNSGYSKSKGQQVLRPYQVSSGHHNPHGLGWVTILKDVSMCSRLLRVDIAQWLYPQCIFRFEHVPDAFKFFGPSQLMQKYVTAIMFDCIDSDYNQKGFRGTPIGQSVVDLTAILPNLARLDLWIPLNLRSNSTRYTQRPWKFGDLQAAESILRDHPQLCMAWGNILGCDRFPPYQAKPPRMGILRLLSHDASRKPTTAYGAIVDVSDLLSRSDAQAYMRKLAKQEARERRKRMLRRRQSREVLPRIESSTQMSNYNDESGAS